MLNNYKRFILKTLLICSSTVLFAGDVFVLTPEGHFIAISQTTVPCKDLKTHLKGIEQMVKNLDQKPLINQLPKVFSTSNLTTVLFDKVLYRRGTLYAGLQLSNLGQVRIVLYTTNTVHHKAEGFYTIPKKNQCERYLNKTLKTKQTEMNNAFAHLKQSKLAQELKLALDPSKIIFPQT